MPPQIFYKQHYNKELKGKQVLDVGAESLFLAKMMTGFGCVIDAVDIAPMPESFATAEFPNIQYYQTPFSEFPLEGKHYDIAICRNTLPFMTKEETGISLDRLLACSQNVFFNLWGGQHEWGNAQNAYSNEEIQALKSKLEETHTILYFYEAILITPTKTTQSTKWHEYVFCVEKK
jgi:hypothetical protein